MPKPRTLKQRLNELQRLHTIWEHADAIVDKRDPKREVGQADFVVGDCDVIAYRAQDAFFRLTYLYPWDVRETELNNTNPSKRVAKALEERA